MDSGDDAGASAGTDVEEQEATLADTPADASADTPAEPGPGTPDAEQSPDPDADAAPDDRDDPDRDLDLDPVRPAGPSAPVWLATTIVLVAALIAGVAVAWNYHGKAAAVDAASADRNAVQSVARTVGADLTTTDYQHPDDYIARLKPYAVGDFLSTYVNAGSGLAKLLQQGKVQTKGQVTQVAVQDLTGTTATVILLAQDTVKNTQNPKGSVSEFRMVLSMIKSGSKWMVSNVKVVQ